jgi:predicted DNA-binding transcriptional regulator AlpA
MAKTSTPAAVARPRLLTRRQAAERLNVSMGTMARWAGDRMGPPFVKLDAGSVRYPEDLLDEFLATRLRAPKDAAVGGSPK